MPCYATCQTPKDPTKRRPPSGNWLIRPTPWRNQRHERHENGTIAATGHRTRLGVVINRRRQPRWSFLADAARAAELLPSTALRQLRSLAAMGFAVQREDGKWAPGPEILRLARALIDYATIGNLSQPFFIS